jgi:hypothetical protein
MSFPRWNLSLGYLMSTPDFIYAASRDDVMRWVKELAKENLIGRYELTFIGNDLCIEAWLKRSGEDRLFVVAQRANMRPFMKGGVG